MSEQKPVELADVVDAMAQLRDKRAELKKAYELEDAKLRERWEKGEAWIIRHLQEHDVKNINVRGYSVFTSRTLQAGIGDWEATKKHILDTGDVDMLQHRISSKAVQQYMEDNNGQTPPGITTRTKVAVNIRKSKGE